LVSKAKKLAAEDGRNCCRVGTTLGSLRPATSTSHRRCRDRYIWAAGETKTMRTDNRLVLVVIAASVVLALMVTSPWWW
jgi:hypothetical protein